MTIQINDRWRITEDEEGYFTLEELYAGEWNCQTMSKVLSYMLISYIDNRFRQADPATPEALILLLSQLLDEIKACAKEK